MEWFTAPFATPDAQRALVAGLLVVVITSTIGTWVVLRGLTFMTDALAHGVTPGLTLAALYGFDLGLGAAVAAAAMVGGITLVHRRVRLPEDVGIGLLFVGMLALAVVIASRAGPDEHGHELEELLFGDVLAVTAGDLWLAAGVAVVTLLASLVLYRPLLVLAFDERKAVLLGLWPRLAHGALLVLLTAAIIASFRAVGVLLVFAFLVAPPAAASLFARRVPTMMAGALVVGGVAVLVGAIVSHHTATAPSAAMALTAVVGFFVVLTVRELRPRRASVEPAGARS